MDGDDDSGDNGKDGQTMSGSDDDDEQRRRGTLKSSGGEESERIKRC